MNTKPIRAGLLIILWGIGLGGCFFGTMAEPITARAAVPYSGPPCAQVDEVTSSSPFTKKWCGNSTAPFEVQVDVYWFQNGRINRASSLLDCQNGSDRSSMPSRTRTRYCP